MDTSNGKLVVDINNLPETQRALFTPVPNNLRSAAERALAGRSETHVSLNGRTALAAWARKKRQQRRRNAKIAKASRKKNRAA